MTGIPESRDIAALFLYGSNGVFTPVGCGADLWYVYVPRSLVYAAAVLEDDANVQLAQWFAGSGRHEGRSC